MPSSNIEELFPHQKPFPFGPLLHGPSGPSGPRTWCDLRASAMLPRHPAASAWCKQWTCGPKTSEKTKFLVSSSITNISVVYHTYTYYIYILNIISIYILYTCIYLYITYCAILCVDIVWRHGKGWAPDTRSSPMSRKVSRIEDKRWDKDSSRRRYMKYWICKCVYIIYMYIIYIL